MKKVFVVIVNFNGQKDTIECLESLMKVKDLNTVIVDNDPQNPIKLEEDKYKDINLKVIYNKENVGFTGGNNVGIKYSLDQGADYVIVLNNDTYVDPDFAKELLRSAEENPTAGIIAPKIYFAKGYEFHKDRYKIEDLGKVIWYAGGKVDWDNAYGVHEGVDEVDNGQFGNTGETEFATGCCLLMTKEALGKVGLFDDKYFLYYEDVDLSVRVKKQGYKVHFNPKSIVWHKNAGSAGGSGSSLQDYYMTRNRLLFGTKYAPLRTRIALFRQGIKSIGTGRPWEKKGAMDFFTMKFGKGSYKL